jgi:hypothetical protein
MTNPSAAAVCLWYLGGASEKGTVRHSMANQQHKSALSLDQNEFRMTYLGVMCLS